MSRPNPDWIGAYGWMDDEIMLTDEEERKLYRPDVKEPSLVYETIMWFLTAIVILGPIGLVVMILRAAM